MITGTGRAVKIAIFASGSGTNAENIIRYFAGNGSISVVLVMTNNKKAGVISRAENLGIKTIIFDKEDLYSGGNVLNILEKYQIDFIVLAGFLWLVPGDILKKYDHRIVNIHPALLPKYGGPGMYGDKVHLAVKDNLEKVTGITIHFVNEKYDDGDIIFQKECSIDPVSESTGQIAQKVHLLEYEYFPKIIEKVILGG